MLLAPPRRNTQFLQQILMVFSARTALFHKHHFFALIIPFSSPSTVFAIIWAPVLQPGCVGTRLISKSTDAPCLNKKYSTYILYPGHFTTWGLPGLAGHLLLGRALAPHTAPRSAPRATKYHFCFTHSFYDVFLHFSFATQFLS